MDVQRYDVRDPGGRFVERYWEPRNTPIRTETARVQYLLHEIRDVTAEVTLVRPAP